MPKLYLFAICEKVITDTNGVVSLIGLFNKVTVTRSPDSPEVPANAVAPKEYSIFTSWDLEAADRGKDYNQFYEFFYPDGAQFGGRAISVIKMGDGKRANSTANSIALPIGQVGVYTARTWLEDDAKKTIFEPISLQFEVEVIKLA
jgi:hypothetical protein